LKGHIRRERAHMMSLMRAYRFMDAKYGLDSVKKRRLKQSRVGELNDPFELTPYSLTDIAYRMAFLQTRAQLDRGKGLLCFSANWRNPLLWAHYSDKQKGLCLGFEIPEQTGDPENDESEHVRYIEKPEQFPTNYPDLPDAKRFLLVRRVLFTKFSDWRYEQEIRIWAPLQNEEGGLYFLQFDKKLQLKEVIVGVRCPFSRADIDEALGSLAGEVAVTKARAAYDKFEMVQDEGF
jgi:hypothetical protein